MNSLFNTMMKLKEDVKSGSITIEQFNHSFKTAVETQKVLMSNQEKAEVFDKLIDSCTSSLTQGEEIEGGTISIDGDAQHYVWEELVQAVYGEDFFQFYNGLYESY